MAAYQTPSPHLANAQPEVARGLEALIEDGVRELVQRLLEAEVDAYLGRRRYQRKGGFRGYRNGYARERLIGMGSWSLPIRTPRVADAPPDQPPFRSEIVPRGSYWTRRAQSLMSQLYLEGLSSGDFEPVFRQLLGERAPLSANTVLRLKDEWQAEFETWSRRPLVGRYPYIWADGIYLHAGLASEAACMLVVIGARETGAKELLALEVGYRESTESWANVLRSLRDRGLAPPRLAVGDGALGLWSALGEVFPATGHQRCWNHRVLNILDRLPASLAAETRRRLRRVYGASSRAGAEAARDELLAWLRRLGHPAAAETVLRDWDDFVRYYEFPIEHWRHLRTSNTIESVFSGIRVRTRVTRGSGRRDNALYLVFKLIERLSLNWSRLSGDVELLHLVAADATFEDGILVPRGKEVTAA